MCPEDTEELLLVLLQTVQMQPQVVKPPPFPQCTVVLQTR